jgi:RNA polymerase sigma-70 factor (ECF subfamily)
MGKESLENLELRSTQPAVLRTGNERERELIFKVGHGDRDAFRELYLHYHRRLARFLTRLTRRHEDAEEIINDTLWIVWQRAADFRDALHVSTWIMGIAYRRALNMIRRAATHERVMTLESAEGETAASDALHAMEDRQLLDFALAQLPLEQRLVIEFTYYLDHSCEEVAEIMECPVNTVKTRMFNARRKLRKILAEHRADFGATP